ncbi:hypothetical protein BY996DRAFT_8422515 [Phakopsora pachyrhizi]|uniref:Uncharacterized protein n=1 Tax=Phakopsora pachyrhizi TaxID=170000 RepID=A0AAV0BVW3_PHAPC|nr:hypothetical protein BY996DRAFT_8422515 [Phakopsora pachyrhizi]CAH7690624.1 hypothetical protein PPACK8108_LOCUS26029 [Phakopsora pachyrhizi]
MKPDGSLPAYDFQDRAEDVRKRRFTILRKDASGQNVFDGGFLGHDNIGLFNQSEPLLTGGSLGQADGTALMAFFALIMLNMALELAKNNQVNEDISSKFFEHFLLISEAMNFGNPHNEQSSLWNSKDGFYYKAISWGNGNSQQLAVRSLNRPEFVIKNIIANIMGIGKQKRKLLALAIKVRLKRILEKPLSAIGGSPTATPLPLSPHPSNVSDNLRSLYQNLIQSPFFDQYSITFIDAKLNKGHKAWTNWVILVNLS